MSEVQTCKISGDGYLMNGELHVPNAEGNRHYKMIQRWIGEGNTPDPEFTAPELLAKTKTEVRAAIQQEAISRMSALVPALNSLAVIDLMAEIWGGLDQAGLGQDIKNAAAVYVVAKSEITSTASMNQAALDAYDPTGW